MTYSFKLFIAVTDEFQVVNGTPAIVFSEIAVTIQRAMHTIANAYVSP
jgi:hypothetical protein